MMLRVASRSHPPFSLPFEVCEHIVDMAYDHDITQSIDHELAIRTMQSCALVCRASRTRSQYWIFHAVRVEDVRALRQFSSHMEREPTLAHLVREVCLVGEHLHAPASAVTALPILLGRRLPNLTTVSIIRLLNPQASVHPVSPLSHLPIHPRFPLSFRSFASLDDLHLESVVFPSFTDFARCLQSVDGVSRLACIRVRWSAPSIPSSGQQVRPLCLPKLKRLTIRLMGMRGVEVLMSSLGASLCHLDVDLPHFDLSSVEDATDAATASVDLRPFLKLGTVKLALTPQSIGRNAHCVEMLRSLLHSWAALLPSRTLILVPTRHDVAQRTCLTREAYASMLKDVGRVTEDVLLRTTFHREREGSNTRTRMVLNIDDIERYHPWWRQQAVLCFPSFHARDRLKLSVVRSNSAEWLEIPHPSTDVEPVSEGSLFEADVQDLAAHLAYKLSADGIPPRSVVGVWTDGMSYNSMLYTYAITRAGYIPQLFSL
ncbi:hypothetical protein C8T65DRAFT_667914 [Cerioporus squamosus]|nr:hypothetical protein C8T65DRAFT_667914 [Cerioporus squamosus]